MKRLFLFSSILLLYIVGVAAQEAYDKLEVIKVGQTPSLITGEMVKQDLNGDDVGYILVKSPLPDLAFEGDIFGDFKKEYNGDWECYFYYIPMMVDAKHLTINHNKYHQIEYNFPQKLKSNEMWEIEVVGIDAPKDNLADVGEQVNKLPININKEYFTNLYIDEERKYNSRLDVEEGTHYLKVKYGDDEYEQKINVDYGNTNFDAILGGKVIIKNARWTSMESRNNSPTPNLQQEKGNTYIYDGLLGDYTILAAPSGLSLGAVHKNISVSKRSTKTLYVTEMLNYMFIAYHGTNVQPVGASIGFYRKFGFLFTFSTHLKDKIETPYGENEFTYIDSKGEEKSHYKSVSMTVSGGPMYRLFRNLFLHVGGGWAHYLQTSEPGVLTADYKYANAVSVNGGLILQMRNFIIAAGYTRQFVKNAFDKNLINQINFSAGFTIPYSTKK